MVKFRTRVIVKDRVMVGMIYRVRVRSPLSIQWWGGGGGGYAGIFAKNVIH